MRISSTVSIALAIALSGCMLPRPVSTPDYAKSCPLDSSEPSENSLPFLTFRLPDCRDYPRIVMSWHRDGDATYGAFTDGRTAFHTKAAWIAAVRAQLTAAANAGRPAVIFIHGYNTGQAKALERAEAIRTAVQRDRPVLAITWPSYASGTKYFWDEANSDWSSAQVRSVLEQLIGDTPVILVAHSMGSRIALDTARFLRRADGSTPVQKLVLAAPDVDRAAFVTEVHGARRLAKALTIYGSREDQALSGSWRLHGYARLGDLSRWVVGDDPEYAHLRDIEGVSVVDTTDVSEDFWAHAAFIETYEGAADLCRVIRGLPIEPWRRRADEKANNIWALVPRPKKSDECSRPGYDAALQLRRKPLRATENGGRGKD